MNGRLFLSLVGTLLCATTARATTITEDFTSYTGAVGGLVWNTVTHKLHVPFVVQGLESSPFSIGNASDGVFDATTYGTFDLNSNAVPTVCTLDGSRIYQFKSFTLPAGVSLRAQGGPALRIRVQGDVLLDGEIDLRGSAGGIAFSPASTTSNAGAAGNGGGSGGPGVSAVVATGTGSSPASSGGGNAGVIATPSVSGGGGANGGNGLPASDAGSGGGALVPFYADATLSTLIGGAGGGGGVGDPGAPNSAGGGGGGGGGALSFQLGGDFTCSATCQILTTGGNGGNGSVALNAGAGGGGAGGSVLIYAGGIGVDDGSIVSLGGTGGTGAPGGQTGGDGGDGKHRFSFNVASAGTGGFQGGGSEQPNVVPAVPSSRSILSHTLISGSYDTQVSAPDYTAFTKTETLQTGDSSLYEIAGSSDAFVSDDTGFVSTSQIDRIDGKRYFKVRVTLQSASAATSPEVTGFSVDFNPGFSFSLVGCARAVPPASGAPWGPLVLLAYFWLLTKVVRKKSVAE